MKEVFLVICVFAVFLSLGYFWYMFFSAKVINEEDEHIDYENAEFNPEVFKEMKL